MDVTGCPNDRADWIVSLGCRPVSIGKHISPRSSRTVLSTWTLNRWRRFLGSASRNRATVVMPSV